MSPAIKLSARPEPSIQAVESALAGVTAQWPPRPRPCEWPQTHMPIEDVLALNALLPFSAVSKPSWERRRGARKLLAWLSSFPGQTWQQRWLASGIDDTDDDWLAWPVKWLTAHWDGASRSHRREIRLGAGLVLGGGLVRPSLRWLLRQLDSRAVRETVRQVADPDGFARVDAYCRADATITPTMRQLAVRRLTWIVMAKGGTLTDITVGDLLELLEQERALRSDTNGAALTYRILRDLQVFPTDVPATLRAARTPGPASVTELIDRYHLTCRPVRDLLIDYLEERTTGLDHSTRRQLVVMLAGNFWADLERHHPRIDSLDLSPEVAAAWKQRLRHIRDRDGRVVRERVGILDVLITVRSLYLDLAQWSAEEPSRWGRWVAPSPISASEVDVRKHLARRKARMDQRTRERLPALPTLVRTAEQRKLVSKRRLDSARAAVPGEEFIVDGERFRRPALTKTTGVRVWADDLTTNERRDLTLEEEHGFWSWAAIEVLRHTGIRIEELLELTHHSFVSYKLPSTGEIVPLLQIAPSKMDKERLLVVTPELGEALTAIIHRVRGNNPTLPLISAYHTADQVWSTPMPVLFQRRHGHEQRAISYYSIRAMLDTALQATGLTDADGKPLQFLPHDFRRIWITDAILHGLPPHIAQVIAGHANINTTIGYKAAYPVEAINTFRGFLARRRQARPSEEYRPVAPAEWDEFLGHFAKRKLALGDCGREYGTPCQHEHACIRCPMLRPDPERKPRLLEIRANLAERIDEAKHHAWLGEINALQATLAATDQKLAEMDALAARRPVNLGMPALPTGAAS